LTGGGTPVANLLTGLGIDEFFVRTDTSGAQTFFTDALGSAVALSDGSGTVAASYTYETFGATSASGTTANSYEYTGRESDSTGLQYYRARYYYPTLQRFISKDPIGFTVGDSHLYAYVCNAPTALRDPSGLAVDPGTGCRHCRVSPAVFPAPSRKGLGQLFEHLERGLGCCEDSQQTARLDPDAIPRQCAWVGGHARDRRWRRADKHFARDDDHPE
jgi:RHS repeat-associated protein